MRVVLILLFYSLQKSSSYSSKYSKKPIQAKWVLLHTNKTWQDEKHPYKLLVLQGMRADLIVCVFFSTTHHVCMYCFCNKRHSASPQWKCFGEMDRCGMWSSCFLFTRRTEEGHCYLEQLSSVFWRKILDPHPTHARWILVIQGAEIHSTLVCLWLQYM